METNLAVAVKFLDHPLFSESDFSITENNTRNVSDQTFLELLQHKKIRVRSSHCPVKFFFIIFFLFEINIHNFYKGIGIVNYVSKPIYSINEILL